MSNRYIEIEIRWAVKRIEFCINIYVVICIYKNILIFSYLWTFQSVYLPDGGYSPLSILALSICSLIPQVSSFNLAMLSFLTRSLLKCHSFVFISCFCDYTCINVEELVLFICVRWKPSQIYVYHRWEKSCKGREMQFFEGSVDRKIPLSHRLQQSEHTGAARCLQEDVSCLTHLVPDQSLYGSELQQSPWETNTLSLWWRIKYCSKTSPRGKHETRKKKK